MKTAEEILNDVMVTSPYNANFPLTKSYILEAMELYAIQQNQAKNNEVLDLVSKCCDEHIEERDLYVDPSDGRMFCNQCGKTLNAEIMKMKRDKVKFNV